MDIIPENPWICPKVIFFRGHQIHNFYLLKLVPIWETLIVFQTSKVLTYKWWSLNCEILWEFIEAQNLTIFLFQNWLKKLTSNFWWIFGRFLVESMIQFSSCYFSLNCDIFTLNLFYPEQYEMVAKNPTIVNIQMLIIKLWDLMRSFSNLKSYNFPFSKLAEKAHYQLLVDFW